MRACPLVIVGLSIMFGTTTAARAAPCPVPTGTHPTIQAAVDDPACTEIELDGQVYVESVTIDRIQEVSGVSAAATTIAGRVGIEGAATVATLSEMTVDGSHPAVAGCFVVAVNVGGDARLIGSNIIVVNSDGDGCLLFEDGFEGGTTGAWGNTVP